MTSRASEEEIALSNVLLAGMVIKINKIIMMMIIKKEPQGVKYSQEQGKISLESIFSRVRALAAAATAATAAAVRPPLNIVFAQ